VATFRDIDYDTRINGDLLVTGSLTPAGGIVGFNLINYAKLDASNTFTSNGAIRIKATADSAVDYTNEQITFDSTSKVLTNKPVDSLSEEVSSQPNGGGTVYQRGQDYDINYRTGTITLKENGSIELGSTVYVTYKKTFDVISLISNDETSTLFAVDSRGNIFGKSITVNLSSSSSRLDNEADGDFIINNGNLTVNGSSTLGHNSLDITRIIGTFKVRNEDNSDDAIVLNSSGHIIINGTRKDNLWDAAYAHSQITSGNPHGTTKAHIGLNKVENKTSEEIRAELTSQNVAAALGYTPIKNTGDTMNGNLNVVGNIVAKGSISIAHDDIGSEKFRFEYNNTSGRLELWRYNNGWVKSIDFPNTSGSGDLMTIEGNKVWHSGNFTPSNFSMGGGTFSGTVYFPGSGIWKSDGNVGIGYTNPSYRLDVNGEIRATGRIIVKVPGGNTAPIFIDAPAGVTMTPTVSKLSAEFLSGFRAGDFFNAAINMSGYGVVEGCEISATTADLRCKISSGRVYIKNYGYLDIPEQEFGGFAVNDYHIVFISGATSLPNYTLGGLAVIRSSTGWPDLSAYAYLNPIVLAKVRPTSSVITDANIILCRQFLAFQYSQPTSKIRIFDSDKEDQTRASGVSVTTRVEINKTSNRTNLKIADLPNANNAIKRITLETDKITFDDGAGILSTITPDKVSTWDDSGIKKHTHYYDAPLNPPTNAGRSFSVASGHVLYPEKTRVYKNGLRQKFNQDYTLSGSTCTFMIAPLPEDTVIIDYDL
jgi:hypothetical protein